MLKGEVGQRARQCGWFDPNRAPLSNVLMISGKLYIPPAEYTDIFLPAYARDIVNGVKHFLIERVTEKSRWFADFNCPADVSFGAAEWEIIAKKIQQTLIELSQQRTGFIVLKVRERECSKNGNPLHCARRGRHYGGNTELARGNTRRVGIPSCRRSMGRHL